MRAVSQMAYATVLCAISLIGPVALAAGDAIGGTAQKRAQAAAAQPAHLACMRALKDVLALEPKAQAAVRGNDLKGLGALHQQVEASLRAARSDMDRAFLTGAWQAPERRQQAAELLGQLEGVQMLNFIGLAFLEGYDSPTGKVSLSIADANGKMFMLLGQLMTALDAFNASIERRAASKGG